MKIRNDTGSTKTYASNFSLDASETSSDIAESMRVKLADDEALMVDIANADAVVIDGADEDLPINDGINALKRISHEDPRTSDGKRIYQPNIFPGDVVTYLTGSCDDLPNGTLGNGPGFAVNYATAGSKTEDMRFAEYFYIAGGFFQWKGAVLGDYLSFRLRAPATVGTSNGGATGVYTKAASGIPGVNVFVPHPTAQGDWDLDLAEAENANLDGSGFVTKVTKVVPVPSTTGAGFFNWDQDTGAVTLVSNPAAPDGGFNLLDAEISLARFLNRFFMLNNGNYNHIFPAIKSKKILPHWKFVVDVEVASPDHSLDIVWAIYMGRNNTIEPWS